MVCSGVFVPTSVNLDQFTKKAINCWAFQPISVASASCHGPWRWRWQFRPVHPPPVPELACSCLQATTKIGFQRLCWQVITGHGNGNRLSCLVNPHPVPDLACSCLQATKTMVCCMSAHISCISKLHQQSYHDPYRWDLALCIHLQCLSWSSPVCKQPPQLQISRTIDQSDTVPWSCGILTSASTSSAWAGLLLSASNQDTWFVLGFLYPLL